MPWTGVNQSPDWDETVKVAKKYLDGGNNVRIDKQAFPNCEGDPEHPYPFEYEVYVFFDDF